LENHPYWENFQNSVLKGFIATPIDVLCSNFAKFGRREIGKIVRSWRHKNFACLSSSRYCANRPQNLPGPAPNNVLRVLEISSKSFHFRRRYSERVNAIKTGRKAFPILGWSLASSPTSRINVCGEVTAQSRCQTLHSS